MEWGLGFKKSWWGMKRRERDQSWGLAGGKRIGSRRDRERRKTGWQSVFVEQLIDWDELESGQQF